MVAVAGCGLRVPWREGFVARNGPSAVPPEKRTNVDREGGNGREGDPTAGEGRRRRYPITLPLPQGFTLAAGARLLNRYTIIDRVASGGMATIYRARDGRLYRVVCVKLLGLELEDPKSTSSLAIHNATYSHFLREALALSKLQHPNTLRIYDFGYLPEGHRPFQVSEFLDGGDLEQHLRARGALGVEETLAILDPITGALEEAHEQKIVHRDIKPSNILFARIGDVLMPKLADFGIAQSDLLRRSWSGVALDDSGGKVALFSPRWAAPEQLTGDVQGPYTDVYALGLVTTYMLTGVVPFGGLRSQSPFAERIADDRLLQNRLKEIGIQGDLKDVLMGATAADPRTRCQSPRLFFEQLRAVLGGPRRSFPTERPEPREPMESGMHEVENPRPSEPGPLVVPSETSQTVGCRRVRVVEVYENLELAMAGDGAEVRFRISILPEIGRSFRIHIKGLNCFVSKSDAASASRPTPAITAREDGKVCFVSTARKWLAQVSFAFGQAAPDGSGHVVPMAGTDLVVPAGEVRFALGLDLGPEREIIVMCKRAA
jgi:eukaryotic-like serine/threonine-protein kinase